MNILLLLMIMKENIYNNNNGIYIMEGTVRAIIIIVVYLIYIYTVYLSIYIVYIHCSNRYIKVVIDVNGTMEN